MCIFKHLQIPRQQTVPGCVDIEPMFTYDINKMKLYFTDFVNIMQAIKISF